jgi:peroxin-7
MHKLSLLKYLILKGLIEIRDFRNLKEPCLKSIGLAHDYAIRKIKFSPTLEKLIGSVSYDMTTKLWNAESCRLVEVSKNHSEFAYSLDFDPKIQNRLVDAGWDNRVIISEFEIDSNFF